MTKLLEKAFAAISRLPDREQDELAAALIDFTAPGTEGEAIDPAHLAAINEGLAQLERGEFASDEEVEAAFRCFDP